jgi:hypothetical protein
MKRTLSLIVLLGLVMGAVVTGCEKQDAGTTEPTAPADTNAAPVAP